MWTSQVMNIFAPGAANFCLFRNGQLWEACNLGFTEGTFCIYQKMRFEIE
jgi:hypothetical protein